MISQPPCSQVGRQGALRREACGCNFLTVGSRYGVLMGLSLNTMEGCFSVVTTSTWFCLPLLKECRKHSSICAVHINLHKCLIMQCVNTSNHFTWNQMSSSHYCFSLFLLFKYFIEFVLFLKKYFKLKTFGLSIELKL